LLAGSHVFGFFRDGVNAQQPVVMFSVGGIPTELADKTLGFNDPSGAYPVEAEVPDTNRLATGDETDKSIIENRKNTRVKDILVALDKDDKEKWSEPETPYKTKYPNNKVFATKSGMVEEWDDTPKHERHHTYHPSGSFEEVANGWEDNPPGTRVHKVNGHNYELIAGDDFIHVRGTVKLTTDGSAKIYIGAGDDGGDLNIQVDRDVNLFVAKNFRARVEGDYELTVNGNYKETIGKKRETVAGENVTIRSTDGAMGFMSKGDLVVKTDGGSDVFLSGSAPGIKLNTPRSEAGDPVK
jgi:hypothetical protein